MENKSAPEGATFKDGIFLDETNYDLWSQIMEMHMAEKRKSVLYYGKDKKTYRGRSKI